MNEDFTKAAGDVDWLIDQLPGDATLCLNVAPGVHQILCNDGEYVARGDWAEMAWSLINNKPMTKWEVKNDV